MAAEPALDSNPATGAAALVWVRCPSTADLAGMMGSCTLAGADWHAGQWQPQWTIPASADGVNEPSIAVSPDGTLGVAWLDGQPGMGSLLFATRTSRGWSPARPVPGMPPAARRDALAFDDMNRPVLAEESVGGIWSARRASTGTWTTWNMGAGSMPSLARAAQSGIDLLVTRPAGDDRQSASRLALSVLDDTGWSNLMPLALAVGDGTSGALATNLRSGASGILATCSCTAGGAPPPGVGTRSLLDGSARLYALDVPAGSAATLRVDGIALATAYPRPGEPSPVRVQLRNTGATTVQPGVAVGLTILSAGLTRRLLLQTQQAIPAGGTTTVEMPISTSDSVIEVAVTLVGRVAGQATLGLPPAPRQVRVTTDAAGAVVQWVPAAAPDIAGYAVYSRVDGAPPVLLGIAHGVVWFDPGYAAGRAVYLVATVDARGRLSTPAIAVPAASPSSEVTAFVRRASLQAQSSGTK